MLFVLLPLVCAAAVVALLAVSVVTMLIHLSGGLLLLCAVMLGYALIRQSRLRHRVIRGFTPPASAN